MAQFTIGGVDYDSKMLEGETQVLVAKRLVGVLALASTSLTKVIEAMPVDRSMELEDMEQMSDILLPVARELTKMSDDDLRFVMDACLGVTRRKLNIGVGWAPVIQSGVVQMGEDGSFINRLGITWNVLRENFTEIGGLLGLALPAPSAAANASG